MKIGLQLYSIRNSLNKDPIHALQEISNMGYHFIETACHNAGSGNDTGIPLRNDALVNLLSELNLSIISAHLFPLIPERLKEIISFQKSLSNNNLVIPMTFFRTKEDVLKEAAFLNQLGAQCAEENMHLFYHNHFYEYRQYDNESILELLMEHTNPDFVNLELDIFWTYRGGYNPLQILKKYGNRISLLHIKDLSSSFASSMNLLQSIPEEHFIDMDYFQSVVDPASFTEMGKGCIDYSSFFAEAFNYCNPEYLILEQDYTSLDELDSVRISLNYLQTLF